MDFDAYVQKQVQRQQSTPAYVGKRALDFSPFEDALARLTEAHIAAIDSMLAVAGVKAIQQYFITGALTSETLTLYYLHRIRRYDLDHLNSVIELNPEALQIARGLDAERASGTGRGSLHGIPILLKDNVATADAMHTTAGAIAMQGAQSDRDSFVVSRLRQAGALILGKTNLSEWANFMTSESSNGFSVLGGQTHNPYGAFDVGGSSAGSGVAMAANLAALSVGSETSGSITYPSSQNAVVGFKPSLGLVSRDRVIPITDAMDTLGPMTRTVEDAARLLTVMAGVDANDPLTHDAHTLEGVDFRAALDANALRGVRVGLVAPIEAGKLIRLDDDRIMQTVQGYLEQAGAVLIAIAAPEGDLEYLNVLHCGMKYGLTAYLSAIGAAAPVHSLADVVEFNAEDAPNRAPFGQDYLIKSRDFAMTDEEYTALVQSNRQTARALIHRVLQEKDVAILVSLSNYLSGWFAPAGCPVLVVPAGYRSTGEPIGAAFIGAYLDDARVMAIGYAFEQASRARRPPDLARL